MNYRAWSEGHTKAGFGGNVLIFEELLKEDEAAIVIVAQDRYTYVLMNERSVRVHVNVRAIAMGATSWANSYLVVVLLCYAIEDLRITEKTEALLGFGA